MESRFSPTGTVEENAAAINPRRNPFGPTLDDNLSQRKHAGLQTTPADPTDAPANEQTQTSGPESPSAVDLTAYEPAYGYAWPGNRLTLSNIRTLALLGNITGRPMNQLIKDAVEAYEVQLLSAGSPDAQLNNGNLEGKEVTRLMAANRVTIHQLASTMQITTRRIRQVLHSGLKDSETIRKWIKAIIGEGDV